MAEKLALKPLTHRGEQLEVALNKHWQRTHDVEEVHTKYGDDLREHAVFIAEHGVSYRKQALQVGAVATGLVAHVNYNPNRPLRRTEILLVEGYNYSPFKGAPKDCAEMRAIRMGDERVAERLKRRQLSFFTDPLRAWQMLHLIVAANAKPDTNMEINNFQSDTLDPCATPCQGMLSDHPAIEGSLPIEAITFNDHRKTNDRREILAKDSYTLDEMHARYALITPPPVSRDLILPQ